MAFENRYNELKWAKSRTEYLEVKKDLESYNWRGDTPLIAAIRGGAIDFVEELIENNINVNQPGFLNETAAMVAAQFNQIEIAELLQAWFLFIFYKQTDKIQTRVRDYQRPFSIGHFWIMNLIKVRRNNRFKSL